jgi:hypothetical protein
VNKQKLVNIRGRFESDALRVLDQIPGLVVTAEATEDPGADAVIDFAGTRVAVATEFRRRVNAATAWQIIHATDAQSARPLLVVAAETTADARDILQGHGVGLIDARGNAHVELPGLLVHIEGKGRAAARRPAATPRLSGKAGVAVQALLRHPDRAWQVQDLAQQAGISTGLAHRVLARLETERVVVPEGSGPRRVRRLVDATALLDLWAEEVTESPARALGYLLAQTPQRLIADIGANLGRAGIDYALTGAAGASLVAPFVTSIPVVDVWVTSAVSTEELYTATDADPVAEGHNVVFLQDRDDTPLAFHVETDGLWVANPFRLYVDLRRDPRRGPEQANHLRQEAIGF